MKTMHKLTTFAASLLIVLGFAVSAFAQATTLSTTIATAVTTPTPTTNPAGSVTLTSGTSVVNGSYIYGDGELMRVTSIAGTPTFNVVRGVNGTRATTHAVGAIVWITSPAAFPQTFITYDPAGTCTATNFSSLPLVNITNSNVWFCNPVTSSVNYWVAWNQEPLTQVFPRVVVANTSYTAKVTDTFIAYTSFVGTNTVTLPSASGLAGKIYIIIDEGGNLASGKTLGISGTINGSTTGPFSFLTTAFAVVRLISNGSNWFVW